MVMFLSSRPRLFRALNVGEAFRDELGVEMLQDTILLNLIVLEGSDEHTMVYS